jgi:hypothetical protein
MSLFGKPGFQEHFDPEVEEVPGYEPLRFHRKPCGEVVVATSLGKSPIKSYHVRHPASG